MLHRYRARPVEITAAQATLDNAHLVRAWVGGLGGKTAPHQPSGMFLIYTLEGDMLVSDGAYIVQDAVRKQFYPCKSDIFEHKYERIY